MAAPKQRVFSEKCSTCVFRPGNLMQLNDRRLQQLISANRRAGTLLICHKTLYGDNPSIGETICRGYWDAYADESMVKQVMDRFFGPDWVEEVAPPTD